MLDGRIGGKEACPRAGARARVEQGEGHVGPGRRLDVRRRQPALVRETHRALLDTRGRGYGLWRG
ncbi:hypothetical protein ACIODW_26150 [Streptomyces sp. NPDC087897]|uniref:hypothetical protein n=1 Tax=Streptomyces sp. NPDC087897 TaxID=3365817 RepID=UPI0037F98455